MVIYLRRHEEGSAQCSHTSPGQLSQSDGDGEPRKSTLSDVPEACIAMILSCLSPREVAVLACVCRSFLAASLSDFVWGSILPPGYEAMLDLCQDIVPRPTSKKEIFDRLCNPVVFANGTKGTWLDRKTGGVCMSVASRGISVIWGHDVRYWDWIPDKNSIFAEVARLKNVCWFEVLGQMECALPPGAYTVSWRILLEHPGGWRGEPAHFTVSKSDVDSIECKCYIDSRPESTSQQIPHFNWPRIRAVGKGWSEYDIGEVFVGRGEGTCVLKFSMLAIENGSWKNGLCLDGVIVRPTNTIRQPQVNSPRGEPSTEARSPADSESEEEDEPTVPNRLRRFLNFPKFTRLWIR